MPDAQLLLPAATLGVLAVWFVRTRSARIPVTGWPLAWMALAITGTLGELGERAPYLQGAHFGAAMFGAFVLAGAYQFRQETVPRWVLPLGVGLGTARAALVGLAGSESPGWASSVFLTFDPAFLAIAATLVYGAAASRGSISIAISVAIFALAGLETLELLAELGLAVPEVGPPLWGALAVPTATLQVVAGTHDTRRAALSALEEARERDVFLRALLESLGTTRVVLFDREGHVLEVLGGPKLGSPYGLVRGDALGFAPRDFLPPERAEPIHAAIRSVFDGGPARQFEVPLTFPRGRFHLMIDLCASASSETGERVVIGVMHDLTDRAEAEERRRTAERAALESQKLESLGVLAGGIAHDFNNLLTGILANVDLARREATASAERDGLLADAERAAEHARDLTRQLLAYAGETDVTRSDIRVPELIQELSGLLRASLSPGTRLEIESDTHEAWVRADASQLRQLVLNLVANAAEAIGDHSGRVGVRVRVREAPIEGELVPGLDEFDRSLDCVSIEVRDDGCGMDAETRARIFDPFFTTKFEGRGLGLAATLGIVRAHGGGVRVESAPGEGSVIELLLPRVAPSPPVAASEPAPPTLEGRGLLLVVDDEHAVRKVAGRMLESFGFEARLFEKGDEALSACRDPELEIRGVLLDLTMPDWDGLELAREIRRLRRELPILLMTGHGPDALARDPDLADAFLAKPFRAAELRAALSDLVGDTDPA